MVASVTSALVSTVSNKVSWASVINLLLVASVKLVVVNVGVAPLTTDWSNAFTSAILVNSLSINAPAAVTLVASVTSAEASIASNLLWSPLSKGTDVVPPIVNASVSSVPSTSTSPLMSRLVASISPLAFILITGVSLLVLKCISLSVEKII